MLTLGNLVLATVTGKRIGEDFMNDAAWTSVSWRVLFVKLHGRGSRVEAARGWRPKIRTRPEPERQAGRRAAGGRTVQIRTSPGGPRYYG